MRKVANKYFEGSATDAELEQLLNWLRKKENRIVFSRFKLDWKTSLGHDQFPGGGEESWNRLQAKFWQRDYSKWQRSLKTQKFLKVAAIFFFIISLGSGLLFYFEKADPQKITYSSVITENGQVSKVILPDSSLVWLNSGSEIKYDNSFAEHNREIVLRGEAYFNVTKNKKLPLIVRCGGVGVKVLGTQFNVLAYSPEKSIEVVLESGAVELLKPESEDAFYKIKPGERVQIDVENKKFVADKVNTMRYTSWKNGIINIYNLRITELIKKLETRYNQKFKLEKDVMHLRYTFTIKNERLEDILNLMEKISPVKAEQKENIIEIKLDKNKLREVGG